MPARRLIVKSDPLFPPRSMRACWDVFSLLQHALKLEGVRVHIDASANRETVIVSSDLYEWMLEQAERVELLDKPAGRQ